MPIYMDVHIVPGVKAKDVAEAHRKDLFHQEEHGCKCMTYWIDEQRENIFCLIEAPEKEAQTERQSPRGGSPPVSQLAGQIYPAIRVPVRGRGGMVDAPDLSD